MPSLDSNNECFSLQVRPLNHYNIKPIHCDSYLIH